MKLINRDEAIESVRNRIGTPEFMNMMAEKDGRNYAEYLLKDANTVLEIPDEPRGVKGGNE